MKTAISVPKDTFEHAERFRARVGKSRSELYSAAMREYLLNHDSDEITRRLNELADLFESEDLTFLHEAGRRVLQRTEWQ